MHNRILTTHAGSLPRSAVLAELHARHAAGETIDVGALQRESEAGERAAVAAQLDAGALVGLDAVQLNDLSPGHRVGGPPAEQQQRGGHIQRQ